MLYLFYICFEKYVNRVQGKLCYVNAEQSDLTVCVCVFVKQCISTVYSQPW